MHTITDSSKKEVAYLHGNLIISLNDEVIGVVLGKCLFSNGKTIGKIIKEKIHLTNGKIIGLVKQGYVKKPLDNVAMQSKAWNIIATIKDHTCYWIEDLEEWDNQSFLQHFN
jgi:hypothetical protein